MKILMTGFDTCSWTPTQTLLSRYYPEVPVKASWKEMPPCFRTRRRPGCWGLSRAIPGATAISRDGWQPWKRRPTAPNRNCAPHCFGFFLACLARMALARASILAASAFRFVVRRNFA